MVEIKVQRLVDNQQSKVKVFLPNVQENLRENKCFSRATAVSRRLTPHSSSYNDLRAPQNKPIRHVVCAGALGRVKPNPRVVPLNEL